MCHTCPLDSKSAGQVEELVGAEEENMEIQKDGEEDDVGERDEQSQLLLNVKMAHISKIYNLGNQEKYI